MRLLKIIIWIASVSFSSFGIASDATGSNDGLSGRWRFREMIYQNQRMPPLNPELNLSWTFFKNGTERLYWDRGTAAFCERFSHFKIENDQLVDEVYALNPQNDAECDKDPDMKIGKKSSTPIKVSAEEIWLTFHLGDEDLIYVLKPEPLN